MYIMTRVYGIYKVIECIYMYIHCTWVLHTICIYHYCICHCILASTALVICRYFAIVQESAILHRQDSDRYIPPKNGLGRWYPCTMYVHVHTLYAGGAAAVPAAGAAAAAAPPAGRSLPVQLCLQLLNQHPAQQESRGDLGCKKTKG